jgi:hypothetical protein
MVRVMARRFSAATAAFDLLLMCGKHCLDKQHHVVVGPAVLHHYLTMVPKNDNRLTGLKRPCYTTNLPC